MNFMAPIHCLLKTTLLLLLYYCITHFAVSAQPTHADSIRGGLRPARTSWDVQHYDLHLTLDLDKRSIAGENRIRFQALASQKELQIDLFDRYTVSRIMLEGKACTWRRDAQALFVKLPAAVKPGKQYTLVIQYAGMPPVAKNAPWDGGFIWKQDQAGLPWVGTAVQGFGASSWWPCKDHPADEPDSTSMHVTLTGTNANKVVAVSNGQAQGVTTGTDGSKTYHFAVTYPLNSYNVTLNVGDYATISDTLRQVNGSVLQLTYNPLRQNLAKAQAYFPQQVKPMLRVYERLLGPYPFPRDGYKLVEVDYWGMEHQSAVAYGNGYGSNPRRFDYRGWDFIIVHETGHEWFGNWISVADDGDIWIHEGFTTYVESLYEEQLRGYESAVVFLKTRRQLIDNNFPIQGPYGISWESPDADMYYKGAWMLHSLRSLVGNDSLWFRMLRGIGPLFGMRTTNRADVTTWIDQQLGGDYQWFWRAYLDHPKPPVLRYKLTPADGGLQIVYRWDTPEPAFQMPVHLVLPNGKQQIVPRVGAAQTLVLPIQSASQLRFDMDSAYYEVVAE